MQKLKLSALAAALLFSASMSYAQLSAISTTQPSFQKLHAQAPDLKPKVLKLALAAYNKAHDEGMDKQAILSVIDFSMPTYKKSLWVFDLKSDKLLYHTYVAHGKGSGLTTATRFSNAHGSDASSLGLYETGQPFYGSDGLSLRLKGLSGKFNDQAYSRDVVMHGAWYVNQQFVDKYHRVGRSWGCPAVSKQMIKPIVNTIKQGSLVFAFANDPYWLAHGPYIT